MLLLFSTQEIFLVAPFSFRILKCCFCFFGKCIKEPINLCLCTHLICD